MAHSYRSGKNFIFITKYPALFYSSQPIQALEHPKFKELVDVVSRATNGVKIPGRKATRAEIMRMFKNHLTTLKARLNVHIPLILLPFLIIQ